MARNYWSEFMNETFGCGPNPVTGNMKCDDGMPCDRCSEPWVSDAFEAWKENEIALEATKAQKELNISEDKMHQLEFMKKTLLLLVGDIKTEVQFIGAYSDTLLLIEEMLRAYNPLKLIEPDDLINNVAEIVDDMRILFPEEDEDDPCDGCGGEDCVCCDVWLERQADFNGQFQD